MRNPTESYDFSRSSSFGHEPEESPENTAAAINWKSVVTELYEKEIVGRESKPDFPRTLGSSFDSGIQQESSSDSDEVSNSVRATLNRLIELSKEQQVYFNRSTSSGNSADSGSQQRSKSGNSRYESTVDSFSVKSGSSEANNLIEEVILKNSCSSEKPQAQHISTKRFARNECLGDLNFSQNMNLSSSPKEKLVDSPIIGNGMHSAVNKSQNVPMDDIDNSEIIVAIDIGTTYSGYAYAIHNSTSSEVKVMKNIQDSEMKKVPSILLLDSRTEFHSFGFDALKYFLNIERQPTVFHPQWLLFDRFKSQLLNSSEVNRDCKIRAVNGISIPALVVYARVLKYFRGEALKELADALQSEVDVDRVRWIVSIPAIWSVKGKSFVQEAALNAGLCSAENVNELIIYYECEATAAYCNLSRRNSSRAGISDSSYFLVVNCGGGTFDASIHQINNENDCVTSEIHKSSEMINNSMINEEFARFLTSILGKKFLYLAQLEKPASLIDLMYQFETCKCVLNYANESADIVFGEAFLEFYERICGKRVNHSIHDVVNEDMVTWHKIDTLRLRTKIMKMLFAPLSCRIIKFIEQILRDRDERKVTRIFLTGGLAKSQILQEEMRNHFENIIPIHEAELSVLKGSIFKYKKQKLKFSKINQSYAIGVIKEFDNNVHPPEKLVLKGGRRWCCDLLDWLVRKDQVLQQGEVILKRYATTAMHQSCIVINIYAVDHENSKFVTDSGVHKYGVLNLSTPPIDGVAQHEILLQLVFTGDEFVINALDTLTSRCDQIQLENLSYL